MKNLHLVLIFLSSHRPIKTPSLAFKSCWSAVTQKHQELKLLGILVKRSCKFTRTVTGSKNGHSVVCQIHSHFWGNPLRAHTVWTAEQIIFRVEGHSPIPSLEQRNLCIVAEKPPRNMRFLKPLVKESMKWPFFSHYILGF